MHCFLELLASNPFYLHFLLSCSPAVLLLWVQGRPILPGPLGTGCSHWPSACHVVVHKKWYMLPLIAASNCKGVCAHQSFLTLLMTTSDVWESRKCCRLGPRKTRSSSAPCWPILGMQQEPAFRFGFWVCIQNLHAQKSAGTPSPEIIIQWIVHL